MTLIDAFANGIVTVLNGLWLLIGMAFSPITLVLAALAASFAWLAILEHDEMDRQATKPTIGLGQ